MVRSLARGLRAAGVDARFVSIYPDHLDPDERAALGVPLQTVGKKSRTEFAYFGRLRRALRAERADIVHAHLIAGKYAGRVAALLERVPAIVFTEHGDDRVGPLGVALDRFLDPRTQRFVAFSAAHRERLAARSRIARDKIVVIPNGVVEPPAADRAALRAELGIAPGTFALYSSARLARVKNHALAFTALARLGAGREHWQLVLAGAGDLEAELRALAADLGIAERVRFLGFRTDAPRLSRAFDAFVMTSLDERMPLALGEAMRCGLPAITTPWTGYGEFITDGETGFVSADYSADAFARTLERLDDGPARERIAERGKAFADHRFDMDACVRRHVELYAGLAAKTPA